MEFSVAPAVVSFELVANPFCAPFGDGFETLHEQRIASAGLPLEWAVSGRGAVGRHLDGSPCETVAVVQMARERASRFHLMD